MTARVFVLYEDSRGDGSKPFGLHELLLALLSGEPHRLHRTIIAVPKRGSSKVLDALSKADDFGGAWVLAIFDEDRIREEGRVGLPTSATLAEVKARILELTGKSARRRVSFLVRNTETVVKAAIDCGAPVSDENARRALKKDRDARDIVFLSAKGLPAVLDCISDKVPCLAEIVSELRSLLAA